MKILIKLWRNLWTFSYFLFFSNKIPYCLQNPPKSWGGGMYWNKFLQNLGAAAPCPPRQRTPWVTFAFAVAKRQSESTVNRISVALSLCNEWQDKCQWIGIVLYNGINIDSHSRFCWQNQNQVDLEFSIVINIRARARASGRSMNWPLVLIYELLLVVILLVLSHFAQSQYNMARCTAHCGLDCAERLSRKIRWLAEERRRLLGQSQVSDWQRPVIHFVNEFATITFHLVMHYVTTKVYDYCTMYHLI